MAVGLVKYTKIRKIETPFMFPWLVILTCCNFTAVSFISYTIMHYLMIAL